MKTWVYVDGFNLYYGALKDTPNKWLDLSRMSALLLPGYQITKIKYFAALRVLETTIRTSQRANKSIFAR